MLETIISELGVVSVKEQGRPEDRSVAEDLDYLMEHLAAFISACEEYDLAAAFAEIDFIKEKTWNKGTADTLNELHDILFLDSDFDAAVELAKKFSMTK